MARFYVNPPDSKIRFDFFPQSTRRGGYLTPVHAKSCKERPPLGRIRFQPFVSICLQSKSTNWDDLHYVSISFYAATENKKINEQIKINLLDISCAVKYGHDSLGFPSRKVEQTRTEYQNAKWFNWDYTALLNVECCGYCHHQWWKNYFSLIKLIVSWYFLILWCHLWLFLLLVCK